MSIVRCEPFRGIFANQSRFNDVLNQAFARAWGDEDSKSGSWAPAVDIYETDENLVVKAELPGVNPKDVEVRVEDSTLYLKGERKFENEVKEENYHRVERSYGSFTRTFALPSSINADKVAADFKDGLLTLTMPKREEAKPKTIKINVNNN